MKLGLYRTIRIGLYLTILPPLLVSSAVLVPQVTPKVLVFQVLCEAILVTALLFMLRDPSGLKGFKSLIWHTPIIKSMGALLAYAAISSFIGCDVNQSWWGTVERQDGLFLWLHFFVWMLLLEWFRTAGSPIGSSCQTSSPTLASQSGECFGRYLKLSFAISVAVAIGALLELVIFRIWGTVPGVLRSLDSTRPSGLFGNPMYLGPYLCFHLFIGFVWIRKIIMNSRRRSYWVLCLVVAGQMLMSLVIAIDKTRGIFVALSAALVLMGLLTAFSKTAPRKCRIMSIAGIAILSILLTGIWFGRESAVVNNNWILGRITTGAESLRMRTMMWKSCLQGFLEKPVFGWGHNNAYYAFNKHYNPEQVSFDPGFLLIETTWTDKSHNAYVDLLVEKGGIGFLLFLGVGWAVIQAVRGVDDWFLKSSVAGSLVAYAVGNLVAFDSFGSLFGLFLMLSFLIAVTAKQTASEAQANQKTSGKKKDRAQPKTSSRLKFGFSIAGLAIFAAGLFVNLEIAASLYGYAAARHASVGEDANYGVILYRNAFSHFSPYEAREKLKCAYLIVNAALTQRLDPQLVTLALEYSREAVAGHPEDAQIYIRLNDMYNGLGIYADKKFLMMAESAGKKALELSPRRQEAMMNLGRTYLLLGQNARAIELGKQMVGDYTRLPVAHWFLGLSLLQAGQKEEAKQELGTAFRLGYLFQNFKEEETVRKILGEKDYQDLRKNP
jgi:O-antigen ligase